MCAMALDLLGAASAIIPPALAALSLGIVGRKLFPEWSFRSEAGTTLLWTAIASAERLSVASSGRPFGKVSKHLRSLDTFGFFSALSCALMTGLNQIFLKPPLSRVY